MTCTRCSGTGFINLECVPELETVQGWEKTLEWINANDGTDASVCDCCGDGEAWFGEPGQHYTSLDPSGKDGPYAYNGGLCECH
jgi:hypothetical protein